MPRNKLLPVPPMPPRSARCTGRTTCTVLAMLTQAIATQGRWVYGTDHHEPGTTRSANRLVDEIRARAAQLELQHLTVQAVPSELDPKCIVVRVQSNIWED